MKSRAKVISAIESLKKMDLKNATASEVLEYVMKLIEEKLFTITINSDFFLYRIRVSSKPFEEVTRESIGYPPNELNNCFKRASTPDNMMFYCWTDFSRTRKDNLNNIIKDIEVSNFFNSDNGYEEKYVVVSSWKVVAPITVAAIFERSFCRRNKKVNWVYEEYMRFVENNTKETVDVNNLIIRFMAHQFKKKRVNRESYFFISALFTRELIRRGLEGVAYQNVRSHREGVKIAISPNTFDSKVELVEFQKYLAIRSNGNINYNVSI